MGSRLLSEHHHPGQQCTQRGGDQHTRLHRLLQRGALGSRDAQQFTYQRGTPQHLTLLEVVHKAATPSTTMIWLGMLFDTQQMTVAIPQVKLQETLHLVEE